MIVEITDKISVNSSLPKSGELFPEKNEKKLNFEARDLRGTKNVGKSRKVHCDSIDWRMLLQAHALRTRKVNVVALMISRPDFQWVDMDVYENQTVWLYFDLFHVAGDFPHWKISSGPPLI